MGNREPRPRHVLQGLLFPPPSVGRWVAWKMMNRSPVGAACVSLGRSLHVCLPPLVWTTLLLNPFSLVLLLVGICAEMNDTSFEFG